MKNIYKIIVAVFGAVATAWFLYSFWQADAAVQSGILALIGAVSAAIYTHRAAQKREIASRHFEKKRETYQNMVNLMFELVAASALKRKAPTQQPYCKRHPGL